MNNCIRLSVLFLCAILFSGCAGQPVVWSKLDPLDYKKYGKVNVKTSCFVPPLSLSYLQVDIQRNVDTVFMGKPDDSDSYNIEVNITYYDPGDAFLRLMLIGLGQMYLDGTVEVKQGQPEEVVREGEFKKNFCAGGLIGGLATMDKDVLPKVGISISEALRE